MQQIDLCPIGIAQYVTQLGVIHTVLHTVSPFVHWPLLGVDANTPRCVTVN